jgi:prepilin-type N-terminal cleavage/methylation domain-containing protein
MRAPDFLHERRHERGISLVEILIALVVLSVGIMAVSSVFPTGTRAQVQTRDLGDATYYALQKIEDVKAIPWTDPALDVGRHPVGVLCDTLGASKAWTRFYNVDLLPAPLTDLKRVIVTVNWTYLNSTRSVTDTTYVRK